MSNEVFEILCAMDRRKIELQIVLQCAPTLAGLKVSNLLILPKDQEDKARFLLRRFGVEGFRLVYDRNRVVFLVFHREELVNYLASNEIRDFLKEYGYQSEKFGYYLRDFRNRYDDYIHNRKVFPHEIGVFLGYPLCDVKGFINNGGEDFKISGYWKVYDNVEETQRLFERFDEIKDDMVLKLSKEKFCYE